MKMNGQAILYVSLAVGGGVLGFYLGGKMVMTTYFQESMKRKQERLDKGKKVQ